jgi:GAF domain-containing protein
VRRRTKQTQAAHPAVGKLAVALKAYKEAVEQQAATADILRALSRSSGNPQPVFDAIVRHAHRLCDGVFSVLYGFDGSRLSILADSHSNPKASKVLRAMYPMPATREHLAGRAVLERVAIHTEDCLADPRFPGNRPGRNAFMKLAPYRAAVTVPLVREGAVIGAIAVARLEPKAFSKSEMRLLQTFAEQALIAMENVRLFNETREALEHQKASAEVLRIVASSVESTAPVFEAITRAGMRLIPSSRASLVLLRDGALHYVSASGVSDSQRAAVAKFFPRPLDRSTPSGTAILDKKIINIADMAAEGRPFRQARAIARASGYQSLLTVPMLRDGEAIGAISVSRVEQGRFSEKQIALVRGFADQAVIAIRNAGFFREIHDRNAELKQSLEFQGALGEILASISSSIADTQPVFDAIVRSVLRLLGTQFAAVQLVKDGQMHIAAYLAAGSAREKAAFEKVVADYPRPVGRETTTGRAILSRKVVQFAALAHDPAAPGLTRRQAAALYESIIASPMLRQGKVIGAIVTARGTPEPFDDRQVALIKSFADQAVIAIENARLFNETKESLDHQRASTEVLKVVSASVSDSQPVFDAIAAACGRLFPGYRVGINVLGGDGTVKLRAAVGIDHAKLAHIFDKVASKYPGGGLFLRGKAVQYPDSEAEGVPPAVREGGRLGGGRAALYAPMVNEGRGIGSIWIGRPQPGPFSEKEVALLQTFAEQAVIALRNARLFSETKEALERQTATAEILKVIASSPSDVQPVFHAIAQAAKRLVNAFSVAVLRVVDDQVHLVALTSTSPAGDEALRQSFPRPVSGLGARSIGVAIDTGRPHASVDLQNDPDVEESVRAAARARGFRGSLAVPMLRGGHVVGIINATRSEAGRFSDHQIELLKTFADQAVIAIENVRLFNETKEALERQTATAEVLQVISASPTDVQPVFQAIAEAAMRLLGAWSVAVCRYDGELMHFAAACGALPDTEAHLRSIFPSPANPDTVAGEAIVERGFVELADATVEDAAACAAARLPRRGGNRHAPRRSTDRLDCRQPAGGRQAERARGLAAALIRRPGRDRRRERAPVQRDQGGARAPDGDGGHPARDQRVADRCATGVREHHGERCAARGGRPWVGVPHRGWPPACQGAHQPHDRRPGALRAGFCDRPRHGVRPRRRRRGAGQSGVRGVGPPGGCQTARQGARPA